MERLATAFVLLVTVTLLAGPAVSQKKCDLSVDCADPEGRTLCYEHQCRRDVPCNKDNDCFFYGAADVASEEYHPACFVSDKIDTEAGYGVCMVEEIVQHTEYNAGISRLADRLCC